MVRADMNQQGETWKFELRNHKADCVYLVKDCDGRFSSWLQMKQTQPGQWEVVTQLSPGRYRLHYFTGEGETYINGGAFGLSGERLGQPHPQVFVELLDHEQYAKPA